MAPRPSTGSYADLHGLCTMSRYSGFGTTRLNRGEKTQGRGLNFSPGLDCIQTRTSRDQILSALICRLLYD